MSRNPKPGQPPHSKPASGTEDRNRDAEERDRAAPEPSAEDLDEQLDKELEDTFPASDPPSLTQEPK